MVQQIYRRLGIEALLFTSAWMVNGLKFEVMGQQARRSYPPHGMFYRPPGAATMPIPQGILRDISNNFYRPNLLNLLPAEDLQDISRETPEYPNWVKDNARVVWCYIISRR